MDESDALLVARLAAGDDHALAEAYDAHAPAVFRVALRMTGEASAAQDVVQDVFVQLWTQPERYDAALASLRTFLAVLARSRALDQIRSDRRRAARQERVHLLSPTDHAPSPAEEVTVAETAHLVQAAVGRLPDGQRRVVELAYFEGLSYREVALATGLPEGTAKSRIRAAMATLGKVLDPHLLESS